MLKKYFFDQMYILNRFKISKNMSWLNCVRESELLGLNI